jgi:hypothetical protein
MVWIDQRSRYARVMVIVDRERASSSREGGTIPTPKEARRPVPFGLPPHGGVLLTKTYLVRVFFHRLLPERLGNLLFVGILAHAEEFVVPARPYRSGETREKVGSDRRPGDPQKRVQNETYGSIRDSNDYHRIYIIDLRCVISTVRSKDIGRGKTSTFFATPSRTLAALFPRRPLGCTGPSSVLADQIPRLIFSIKH